MSFRNVEIGEFLHDKYSVDFLERFFVVYDINSYQIYVRCYSKQGVTDMILTNLNQFMTFDAFISANQERFFNL